MSRNHKHQQQPNLVMRQPCGPEFCGPLGLECGACIKDMVANVRQVVGETQLPTIPPVTKAAAFRLFNVIYPSPGCAPMRMTFVRLLTEQPKPHSKGAAA